LRTAGGLLEIVIWVVVGILSEHKAPHGGLH